MAAANEAVLLNSVCQELRPTERKSDFGQQIRQQRLPLVPIVMDPGKHSLKHLRRRSTDQSVTWRFLIMWSCFSFRGRGSMSTRGDGNMAVKSGGSSSHRTDKVLLVCPDAEKAETVETNNKEQ